MGLNRSTVLAAVGTMALSSACGIDDQAVLEVDSLLISPCSGDEDRLFAPFRFEADFLRWYEQGNIGFLEMRDGFRAATLSDAVYMHVSDVEELKRILDANPDATLELDGDFIRLTLILLDSCPDSTQTLLASHGRIRFEQFDNWLDGRIAGSASFDLIDGRTAGETAIIPVATNANLTFELEVRRGPPYQEYTN